MSTLKPLLRQTIIEGAIAYTMRRNHRNDLAGFGMMVFAAFIGLFSFAFLSVGVWFWLTPIYGEAIAAWLAGLVLLVVTGLFVLLGYQAAYRKKEITERQARAQIEQVYDLLADELALEIGDPVRENPKTALAAAALAGFIAGDRI